MKCGKTYSRMMRRSVRGTLSRFLAILCIVALGTGFLCGLLSTEPDMKTGADEYYDEQNAMDFLIQGTLGLTQADVEALEKEPYIEQAAGKYSQDMLMRGKDEESYVTRVIGEDFDDEHAISRMQLLEGRFPENNGECVIEVPNMYAYEIPVGETFTIDTQNKGYDDLKESLSRDTFKVVGIVRTPQFIHMTGDVSTVGDGTMVMAMYVPEDVYTLDYYTAIYATAAGAKELDTYSTEYTDLIDEVTTSLKPFGEERAEVRAAELRADAQEEYDKAAADFEKEKSKANDELDEAKAKIDSGRAALEDGKAQLADGKAQIEAGRKEIEDRLKEIEAAEKELADGRKQLSDGRAQLAAQDTDLKAKEAELAQAAPGIEQLKAAKAMGAQLTPEQEAMIASYDQGVQAAAAGRKQIDQAKKDLDAKEAELTAGEQKTAAGRKELEAAAAKIDQEEAALAAGETELAAQEQTLLDAEKEYEAGRAEADKQFADAEKELKEAQKKIDKIEAGKWIIRDRSDNIGMREYDSDSAKIGAIAKVFPVFFFVIAALVALTTLTRMVEEERGRIGTLKSLGYTNGAILRYYLLYGLFASAAGCLIGIPFGCVFFPKDISNAYTMMYVLPDIRTPVLPYVAIPVAGGLTVMILLATWLSCRDMLKEKPAALLLPKAPKVGKRILLERIGPLWRALPFSRKVTLRNVFRYKKRFLMTIIGVAGCFALLLAGFGIRDSIGNLVSLQYGEVTHYDYAAEIDHPDDIEDDETLAAVLADPAMTDKWCAFSESPVTIRANGKKEESTFRIPRDPSVLEDYVTLRGRIGHAPVAYEKGSVVLTEKSAENLGVEPGDTLQLTAEDGTEQEVVLTGVCENYIGSYVYMYTDDYEAQFDDDPSYTTIYLIAGEKGKDGKAASSLLSSDKVLYIVDTQVVSENFAESVKSIDYIIMVLIVASGALAIIVLYNLTNVNICERRKELATIRVLGFYRPEVSAYIFREVDILAVIGILVGIPVGIWLHHFIIITVEVAEAMFGRTIHWQSYLIAAGFTILFTVLVNLIMRREIRKIDMVESMKAVD